MGIAHHSNHLVWFEVARTDLCRDAGLAYREIEDRGMILVVTEAGCRYRGPFHYDDEVIIETFISKAASRSLVFTYELRREGESTVRADGFTRHVWLDGRTRAPIVAPRDVMELFRPYVRE